ncbi:MAG TPA: aldolase/citrate lyase family protein [Terriglobales bacterium]|nr:aldolase/citrate lyase family protein [Terriglobales bacterium]
MKNIRERLRKNETLIGCFLNLGSSLTAEIVGRAGFDWALIDLEHGAGFESEVLHQLQALEATPAAAVIRVEGSERQRFHRVLDLGAHGIMVPRVDTADDAKRAVAAMRYQPEGVRGVAQMNRAAVFGSEFARYFASANSSLLTVLQVETKESLANLDAIAAIDGCDVLFVGPADLSQSLGILGQVDHPVFLEAVKATANAARKHQKTAGILAKGPEDCRRYWDMGYRFIACNSDGGLLNLGARGLSSSLKAALPA